MRTTVDLPDPVFRELKMRAAKRGMTLKELIHKAVVGELMNEFEPKGNTRNPHIPANGRKPYNLTSAEIEDLLT